MAKPFKPEAAFRRLKDFDFARARVSLRVFRKRSSTGNALVFSAVWVDISKNLADELKAIAIATRDSFTEAGGYGLLEQPNESELLVLRSEGTSFAGLELATAGREEANRAKDLKSLSNAAGYVVKIKAGPSTLSCYRKATSDWKAKKSHSLLNLVFVEQQLDIAEDPVFRIARSFDFFGIDEYLLVADKRAFESVLNYKTTYENSFTELRGEQPFIDLFSDLTPLQEYVGTNAMHLRRMAVVRDKGYYKDQKYIARLKTVNGQRGWGIQFDGNGRIMPTAETARVIMQVLLNHRLYSELSLTTYDVPSTTPV